MSSVQTSDGVEVGAFRTWVLISSLIIGFVSLTNCQWSLSAMWFGSAVLLMLWIVLQNQFFQLYIKRGYPEYDPERAKRNLNYYIDYVNGFALTPDLERAARITKLFGTLWIISLLTVTVLSVVHLAKS